MATINISDFCHVCHENVMKLSFTNDDGESFLIVYRCSNCGNIETLEIVYNRKV